MNGLRHSICKQKTAYELRISGWSSDVGSSDLAVLAILARMQHKAAAGFDRSAEVHANLVVHRQRPDAELRQQVGEGDGADQAVDHQPHGAVGMMGADVDDGDRKSTRLNSSH